MTTTRTDTTTYGGQSDPVELSSLADAGFARGDEIGRFVVLSLVGSGGMGVVLEAFDPELSRNVALKLLHPGRSTQQGERLRDEARALARVTSPQIAAIYDVARDGDYVLLAMELVRGPSLRDWLRTTPRTWPEIRDVFVQAGRGLADAHAAGIVHGDFKPSNVVVSEQGRVKVVDFGLAREHRSLDAATVSENARRPAGTAFYMAPEVRAGTPSSPASDQYSLCRALHEALTVSDDFPVFVRPLLERGLAPDPGERYPSMSALLKALEQTPKSRWRRAAGWASGAVGLSAALGGLIYGFGAPGRSSEEPPSQEPPSAVVSSPARPSAAPARPPRFNGSTCPEGLPSDVEGISLVVSASTRRREPVPLDGTGLYEQMFVFAGPEAEIEAVRFFVDDPHRSSPPYRVESHRPFDLTSTEANGDARPFDISELAIGEHSVVAEISTVGGGSVVVCASFHRLDPRCGLLPCDSLVVEPPLELSFEGSDEGIPDARGVGTGFTYVDGPPRGLGFVPHQLLIDPSKGTLEVRTRAGLAYESSNDQDNALGVAVATAPGRLRFATAIVEPSAGMEDFEQAGLWLGRGQEDYARLAVMAHPQGTMVEFTTEVRGETILAGRKLVSGLEGEEVELALVLDLHEPRIVAFYRVSSSMPQRLAAAVVPEALQQPEIFGGIFASHRLGPEPVPYRFSEFVVSAEP